MLILDPATGSIRQKVELPAEAQSVSRPDAPSANILAPDKKGQVSFTGLIFSRDGKKIYLSNVDGSIKVFTVDASGNVKPSHSILLPPAQVPRRKEEIPTGLALSHDGKKLYVCGNMSNQLIELNVATGEIIRVFPVGVAPYDVAIVGDKANVSYGAGGDPRPAM